MKSLYEITQEMLRHLDIIDGEGGVVPDELFEQFSATEAEFSAKVERSLAVASRFRAAANADKEWAKRIAKQAASLEAHAVRMEEWVASNMQDIGIDNVKTDAFGDVKLSKPRAVVSVLDETEFVAWASAGAPSLLRIKPPEINKIEVKKLLDAGEEMPGVALADGKVSVRYTGRQS